METLVQPSLREESRGRAGGPCGQAQGHKIGRGPSGDAWGSEITGLLLRRHLEVGVRGAPLRGFRLRFWFRVGGLRWMGFEEMLTVSLLPEPIPSGLCFMKKPRLLSQSLLSAPPRRVPVNQDGGCSLTPQQVTGSCFFLSSAHRGRRTFLWCRGPTGAPEPQRPGLSSWASEPEPRGETRASQSPVLPLPSSLGPGMAPGFWKRCKDPQISLFPPLAPASSLPISRRLAPWGRHGPPWTVMLSAGLRAGSTGQALRDPGRPLSSPSLSLPRDPGR